MGKSRLAVQVAAEFRSRFPDGVWLAELAPLPPGGPVAHTVAAALRVQQRPGQTITGTAIEYLRPRSVLLVIDNCEHVLDAAARFVGEVVTHCPHVVVLATSREPLGVPGEQVLPVPPLPAADAYTLFVERARAVRPDFPSGGDGTTAVSEICRRVDGLPLAIELAAARMRAMSPEEVARRLDTGHILVGGRRVAPRHQSLGAAIDWSYQLLDDRERRFFDRMSVCAGGCDLAAAHAVCADAGEREEHSLEVLAGLVDKSMVVADSAGPATRYRLLETLRSYGGDRLRRYGDADAVERRHARYFTDLAERAALGMRGPEEARWVAEVLPDYDNLRVAVERVLAGRDVDRALRLAAALPEVAFIRVGYEPSQWALDVLDLAAGSDHPLLPMVYGAAARGAWARADFPLARRLARAAGPGPVPGPSRIAHPRDVLADVALYEGDVDAALRHYRDEVREARVDGDPIRLVWTLYYVAVCQAVRRIPEPGLDAAEESLDVALRTANPTAVAMGRYALGLVLKKSEPRRATSLFDAGAESADSVRNLWWYGIAAMEAAATRGVHGDPVRAASAFLDVLGHWERVGDRTQQWLNLRYITRLAVRLGADTDAAVLHGALLAAGRPSPLAGPGLAALAQRLGGARFRAAVNHAGSLPVTDVVGVARETLRRRVAT